MPESIKLNQLKPAAGSIKRNKRIGRGRGSGYGDTATKGHKGAKSRAGHKSPRGFEGGQMPMQRRIPKRGFTSVDRTKYLEVKLTDLERIDADEITPVVFRETRVVRGRGPIVLLGNGEVSRALKVSVHRATKSAREKIEAAGGSIELLPLDPVDRRVKKGPKPRARERGTSTGPDKSVADSKATSN